MAASGPKTLLSDGESSDDSPVTVLRQLNQQRGRVFSDAEYRDLREAVLEELAQGARLRPFTLFTFAVVELGLAGLLVIGLLTSPGRSVGDFTLSIVCAIALLSGAGFFWFLVQGIRRDRERSLDERLKELQQLLKQQLVSPEEYDYIHAHILNARQHSVRL